MRTLARSLAVVEPDYFGANYRWHPRDDRLVYLQDGKLFAVDLRKAKPGAVPKPRELAPALGALTPEPLLFTADGRSVVAIYPGAPISGYARAFAGGDPTTLPNLLFTSRGYAVVLPDLPLGPEGKPGEPVREMVDALVPQLQHAADAGWIDFGRLGLMGQSYGGYGTAAIVSRTSLFRAAVAISGLYDLPGLWGRPQADGSHFFQQWAEGGQGHMGGPPWAELPRYLANSPYYQVEHIHTPLLLIHGTKDDAVGDARKLFTALDRLGRTAQYAEYEGEGHVVWGWRLPDAADAARRVTEFFARYLGTP